MREAVLFSNSIRYLIMMIAFSMFFWGLLYCIRAIVKQEFRNSKSGEVLTGPRAIWAALIRIVLFSVFFILFAIALLHLPQ